MCAGRLITLDHKSGISTFGFLVRNVFGLLSPALLEDVVMGIYKKKWEWGMEAGRRDERGEQVLEEGAEVEREKDGRVRGGKEQTLWKNGALNEGVDAGDGADGVWPPLLPHTPGGNSRSETTLTRCGQQLSSCCSCLVCSPLQYVWCARRKCSHLYPALVWHSDIHVEFLWVKKQEETVSWTVIIKLLNVENEKKVTDVCRCL